jgi:hypothetical protein
LSVSEGRRGRELRAALAFRENLGRDPQSIVQVTVATELRGFLANRDTAGPALGAVAALPGTVGPDILYEVWTGVVQKSDVTELARMLVNTKDVRGRASPALNVALDLRAAETCEQSRDVLGRARKQGDRRSLHLLRKLLVKSGCGPAKRQDCYPCLREGDDLKQAIALVATRPAAPNPLSSR